MPATANFHRLVAGSSGQRKSILRNLVCSLIIHESITTTFSKAKAVQPYAERVITMGKKYVGRRDQRDRAAAHLYDWKVTLPKLFDTLAKRYKTRPGGYTRIHRLPPRFGDMAPLAILELVDGKRDMHFCMTARRVARSQILDTKWLSESTRDDMFRIFQFKGKTTVKDFDKEVERQKAILLEEDKVYEGYRRRKQEKTLEQIQERIDERLLYTTSIHNRKARRTLEKEGEDRRRRKIHMSEKETKDEEEKSKQGAKAFLERRHKRKKENAKKKKREPIVRDGANARRIARKVLKTSIKAEAKRKKALKEKAEIKKRRPEKAEKALEWKAREKVKPAKQKEREKHGKRKELKKPEKLVTET